MKKRCTYPGCEREALKDWTNCARHHSAGLHRKQAARIQKARKRREPKIFNDAFGPSDFWND